MKRTLLITGGSGYLGAHLAQAAVAQDWQVFATYHTHPFTLVSGVALPLDLRDADKTRAVVRNISPEAIVHTACSNRADQAFSIVPAAMSVASAAREFGARLVHVSSDMVFDGEHAPYADEAPPAPVTSYGRVKAEAEALVSQLYPPAVVVRPSLIWGLKPIDHQTLWLVDGLQRGDRMTLFVDEFRSPVYIHDLCAALLELAAQPELHGPMNLGGAQAVSRWDFGLRLLAALHVEPGPNLVRGFSRDSGLVRPRDLTMRSQRAAQSLKTRLRGAVEVLDANARA